MIRNVLLSLTLVVATTVWAQSPHTHRHSLSDAEKWAQVFDDPERDAWQKPPRAHIRAGELPPPEANGTAYKR